MPTAEFAPCGPGQDLPLVPKPFCKFCATPIPDEYGDWGRCYGCTSRLKELNSGDDEFHFKPYAFDRAGAAGLYVSDKDDKGEVGAMVLRMKRSSSPVSVLSAIVVSAMARRYADFKPGVIVPMPSASSKSWQPAVGLAAEVAKALNVRNVDALILDPSYESKRDASQAEKFDSCRDKIQVWDDTQIHGKRALIVDDVMTTAGHAHWAALALLSAGAARVYVMVAARTVTLSHLGFIGYAGRM